MIPWVNFRQSEQHPDWRIDLNSYNLHHYVPHGPSQLKRGLDSSMLELAHERQFAISQLGTESAGYEVEHGIRVEGAIKTLSHHFMMYPSEEGCRPTSPFKEDLMDFREQYGSPNSSIPWHMVSYQSHHELSRPSARVELVRPRRSALAVRELMNPAPSLSSRRKRKLSDDCFSSMDADDGLDVLSEYESDLSLDVMSIQYSRARHVRSEGAAVRTHRGVRMRRRSQPVLMDHHLQHDQDTVKKEKDAHLLLHLSQRRSPLGS